MSHSPTDRPTATLRDSESTGLNRARLGLELRRAILPFLVLAGLAVVAVVAAAILLRNIGAQTPFGDYYKVQVAIDDAKGVVTPGQQDVRIAGVSVGEIEAADLSHGKAVLTLSIESKYAPLYRDARLRLRPQTPLQDMYLNIEERGSPEAGEVPDGETLSAERTTAPVDISRVLNVFDRPTRGRFEAMIDEFGRGLTDRGDELRATFVEITPFLRAAQRLSRETAVRRDATRRLVHSLRLMMDELARREAQVARLVSTGSTTFAELERAGDPLDRLLVELPPTIAQLRDTSRTLDWALGELDPALVALLPTADALDPALEALTDLGRAGEPAFGSLRRVTRELLPLAKRTLPLARELERAFRRLGPAAPRLDRTTEAIVPCELALQKFFQSTPSVFKFRDLNASYPRGEAVAVSNAALRPGPSCAKGGPR
jgi:phospholipid/cholesterol/gamma-HCH transport system substrate-binding protein